MHDTNVFKTETQPRRARVPLAVAARVRSSLTGIVRALAAVLLCALLLAGCSKEPAGEDQCGRPQSYPYVLEGKYIVAADADGDYGGPIHENWTAADIPAHHTNDPANAAARIFEVAKKEGVIGVPWADAKEYCRYYSQGDGGGWRLPTLRELGMLYDAQKNFSIDHIFSIATYWSCTEDPDNADNAAHLYMFFDGQCGYDAKTSTGNRVRCVRDKGVKSWPYVVDGQTIVFAEREGGMDGPFHPNWNSTKTVLGPTDDAQSVPRKLRVGYLNALHVGGIEAARTACRGYDEGLLPSRIWRLATMGEAAWIRKLSLHLELDFLFGMPGYCSWCLSVQRTNDSPIEHVAYQYDRNKFYYNEEFDFLHDVRCVADIP